MNPMFLSKAIYFFFYGAAASLFPFLVIYYENLGLSGYQIGFLAGIMPLIALFSAPLWGGLADATQKHKILLLLAMSTSIVIAFALSNASAFLWLIPLVVLLAFFIAPIMPIVDNSVMDHLADHKDQYGKLRLWGAIGWGATAPVIGWVIERSDMSWAFYGYMILMSAALLVTWKLTVSQAGIGSKFWTGLRSLLSNPSWSLFLFTVFVFGIGSSVIQNFLFLYMNDLEASKTLMGLSLMFATISELPVLYFSDRLLNRFGSTGMIIFSMSFLVLRLLAYSFIRIPLLILMIQLLHGPTYSAMWVSGVSYAAKNAPHGMGATAQGLFSGVLLGLSAAVGAFIGGFLYENIGPVAMFRLIGFLVLLGIVLFLLIGKKIIKLESPASLAN
jgi:PPP family 3-phenylpropionic acid transporter